VQILAEPFIDFRLPVLEPLAGLTVDLGGAGLEDQNVPAVLQGGDVIVERLPVVADDDHAAGGGELAGQAVLFQAAGVGMPGDRLLLLGLAQAFQEADAGLVGVERIDIVDHDEAAAMPIKLFVHAKGRGIALDPGGTGFPLAWPGSGFSVPGKATWRGSEEGRADVGAQGEWPWLVCCWIWRMVWRSSSSVSVH
jgi:hypothetical protein